MSVSIMNWMMSNKLKSTPYKVVVLWTGQSKSRPTATAMVMAKALVVFAGPCRQVAGAVGRRADR